MLHSSIFDPENSDVLAVEIDNEVHQMAAIASVDRFDEDDFYTLEYAR